MTIVEGSAVAADGLRLRFEVDGPDGAPLLLCAAGGPGRASEYLGGLGGLSRSRRLVRVDVRGTGRSEAPDDPAGYAPERLVDDLEQVRAAVDVARVDVLGHSAGGPVALGYAAAHPDRVRRLVLVTTYLPGQEGRDEIEAERERIRSARAGEDWYADAAEAAEAMAYARPAEQQRLSRLQRPFYYGVWNETTAAHAAAADRQMSPRAETAIRQAAAGGLDLERLRSVATPTLVLAAALDVLTPPTAGRTLAERLPSAEFVVLDGVGHFPWVDGPDRFVEAVEEFLTR